MSPSQKNIKRMFDFCVALCLIIFILPLLIVLMVLGWWSFQSSPIYVQKRVGLHGSQFNIYKLKSMVPNPELGTVTTSSDPRITPYGAFLRRFKLDELPQLFCVLIGTMSLVGPRPDVPGYADRLRGEQRIILSVRPGITGPASVMFRDEEKLLSLQSNPEKYNDEVLWPMKVKLNIEYINNYSFCYDLRCLMQTIGIGLPRHSKMNE